MTEGSNSPKLKDVYEIAERLEDKFDRRLEQLFDEIRGQRDLIDRIDREGAIGTRDTLVELARQAQEQDKRIAVIEARPPVTRQDIHELKSEIAALKLWQAGLAAVSSWKRWQVTVALAVGALAAGIVGSVATIIWLKHG